MKTRFDVYPRFAQVAFVIVLSCIGTLGQQPVTKNEAVDAPWIEYKSVEGRYKVFVPKEPQTSTQDGKAQDGTTFKQYLMMVFSGNALFSVGYFDYANREFSLEKARDGMVRAVKGTLVSDESISLNGNPGREILVTAKLDNGAESTTRSRIYDVSGRVYILQHMYFKNANPVLVAADSKRFYDSFTVNPAR